MMILYMKATTCMPSYIHTKVEENQRTCSGVRIFLALGKEAGEVDALVVGHPPQRRLDEAPSVDRSHVAHQPRDGLHGFGSGQKAVFRSCGSSVQHAQTGRRAAIGTNNMNT